MQETFLLKILSKVVLFLVVKFIYSTIKMTFQKRKSHAEGVLQISKKFAFGVWGRPNKHGKGYPFPLLALGIDFIFYMIFIASNYFTIHLLT